MNDSQTLTPIIESNSIKRLAALERNMNERLDSMQQDIRYVQATVDERFTFLNNRIDGIVGSLAVIQQSLDKLSEGK